MSSSKARKVCAQVAALLKQKGISFDAGWTFQIRSPYSGSPSTAGRKQFRFRLSEQLLSLLVLGAPFSLSIWSDIAVISTTKLALRVASQLIGVFLTLCGDECCPSGSMRALRSSGPALPYIARLIVFRRFIWPSAWRHVFWEGAPCLTAALNGGSSRIKSELVSAGLRPHSRADGGF